MDKKKQVISEIFNNMYTPEGTSKVEFHMANMKAMLESIPRVDCFVTSRVKAPLSVLKKLSSDDKYTKDWNSMKDLLGLMVVVETNQDVDNILYYIEEHYAENQNPHSEQLYRDYRKENYRNKNGLKDDSAGLYDPPSQKGYQIHNGYKNVRINLMINQYPIEIQVKTKEQYVAHQATHDPVYKSPWLNGKEEETKIAGGLFPYFEACAHLDLHRHEMTERQIARCKADINDIFERNRQLFTQYPVVFNDACRIYAVYMFILKNQKQIYSEATLGDSVMNMKLLESEILRVFHYKQKEMQKNDLSLTENDSFVKTLQGIVNMSYDQFKELRTKLAGSYRMEACVITGLFDLIRKEDIDTIQKFTESFRRVQVSVFDDQLAQSYLGRQPMFSFDERAASLKMIKGVSDVDAVGMDGKVKVCNSIAPLNLDEPRPKKYKIGYLPGVFDMLHPGHIEYIKKVTDLCDTVIIGAKSDDYVRNIKSKEPVLQNEERKDVLYALRGIGSVITTDYDIALPVDVRDIMMRETQDGGKCAIFAGSDWFERASVKGQRSSEELEALIGVGSFADLGMKDLDEQYRSGKLEVKTVIPNVYVTCIPRSTDGKTKKGENKRSSTGYRDVGIWERDNVKNIYELTTLGE